MGALKSFKRRLRCVGLITSVLDLRNQGIEVVDNKGGMCLARRAEIRFDAEMELYFPSLEPGAAALCKVRRFGDFGKAQLINIKAARLVFFTSGHSKLDVIDGKYFHGSFRKAECCAQLTLRLYRQPGVDPGGEPA